VINRADAGRLIAQPASGSPPCIVATYEFYDVEVNRVACTWIEYHGRWHCCPSNLETRFLLLHTAPASHKHASPIASAQGRNRAFQTVSPVITVPELLPRRLVSNPIFEAGRVLSRIVSQRRPVVAHVHLTAPGSVVAERVQRRVVSVTHDKLRARRWISPMLRNVVVLTA
jgi:hypothetical protein